MGRWRRRARVGLEEADGLCPSRGPPSAARTQAVENWKARMREAELMLREQVACEAKQKKREAELKKLQKRLRKREAKQEREAELKKLGELQKRLLMRKVEQKRKQEAVQF